MGGGDGGGGFVENPVDFSQPKIKKNNLAGKKNCVFFFFFRESHSSRSLIDREKRLATGATHKNKGPCEVRQRAKKKKKKKKKKKPNHRNNKT